MTMFAKPQSEHQWLDQLVGSWDFQHDCKMPDGSTSKANGKMTCRSLGGMWLICESTGDASEEESWSSIMTLGFDPAENQYVGTFVGSMMTNIWRYTGNVDPAGKRLTLDAIGPSFDGSGECNYRDTIAIIDANNWTMSSEMEDESGQWIRFMSGTHLRC